LDLFWMVAPLVVLGAISASLRFYCLGCRSLWLDEVATSSVLMQPTLSDAINYAAIWTDHTPLHFILTWLAGPLGRDEFAVRVPYAIAGTLASFAMYKLGTVFGGRIVGWIAGLLVAILPFSIYYSQESRPTILLILVTVTLMWAAHSVAHRPTILGWIVLTVLADLDIYTGYLAFMAVGVAYGYVGLIRLWAIWQEARDGKSVRPSLLQFGLCLASAAVAAVAFLPWQRHFRDFLARPDLGFGRVNPGAPLTVDAANQLLAQLDLHGIVFWLAVAGIVTAVVDILRRRSDNTLLPLLWLFLPLAFFAYRSGPAMVTIWTRYYVISYPVALLLAAIGAAGVGRLVSAGFMWLVRRILSRLHPRQFSFHLLTPQLVGSLMKLAIAGLFVAMVGVEALPADAAAYQRPKGSDYRGLVDRVLAADGNHPTVLVVGPNPDWTVSGLRYYAWARSSSLQVIDPIEMTYADLEILKSATSVWGAVLAGPTVKGTTPPFLPLELYNDVYLLPTGKWGSAGADAVLEWAQEFEPALGATKKLVEFATGQLQPGPELLRPPSQWRAESGPTFLDQWTLQPNVSVAEDGRGFVLKPQGTETNAIYATQSLPVGGDYLLTVACDPRELSGWLSVFVVLQWPGGSTTLPSGAGYVCPAGPSVSSAVVSFFVTEPSTSVTILLRATGTGIGTYSEPSLRSLK
jgi:hypothetical protein